MRAYYNDFDEGACAWLRELIKQGHIADGVVDNRSILEVDANELKEFTQCHFFAGIGGWSYALRLAEWPDERPIWTGSPPCQPFSAAGKGDGRDDDRHLAPHFLKLVREARPAVLFGEQVASAAVFGKATSKARKKPQEPPQWAWLDDLSDRLEAAHYAVGASDLPSAGVGAPNIRQRTFFGAYDLRLASSGLGDSLGARLEGHGGHGDKEARRSVTAGSIAQASAIDGLGDTTSTARERHARKVYRAQKEVDSERKLNGVEHERPQHASSSVLRGLAESDGGNASTERQRAGGQQRLQSQSSGLVRGEYQGARTGFDGKPDASPTNGFWRDADWLFCRDGRWRPVEACSFPLAHGVSSRVGLLRGYGNAINPHVAKEFILAFMEAMK